MDLLLLTNGVPLFVVKKQDHNIPFHTVIFQFFPNMAGLQPPILQKVSAFHVHSGEFVQIKKSHWCVVSDSEHGSCPELLPEYCNDGR